MTPKEKAKQLINKFTFASIYFVDKEQGAIINAKFCAKLAVDEILNQIDNWGIISVKGYWQRVKQEIEKL